MVVHWLGTGEVSGSSPGKGFYHENKLWFEYCANTCMVDVFSGDHVESRSDIWLLYKYNIIQPQPQKKKMCHERMNSNKLWIFCKPFSESPFRQFKMSLFLKSIQLLETHFGYILFIFIHFLCRMNNGTNEKFILLSLQLLWMRTVGFCQWIIQYM